MDLSHLKAWCDQARGRRSEAARKLGTSKQAITDWFAGRRQPTAEQQLAINDFMNAQQTVLSEPVLSEPSSTVLPQSTQELDQELILNEYNEMIDDPGYVSPPMMAEEQALSDAVLAELVFSLEPIRS
jgi:hypothetical protein